MTRAIVEIGSDSQMAKQAQNRPKRRTFGARLSRAFFRWESAITIALTIILIFFFPQPFSWWQWWYWLVLGVAAEVLIIASSLSDVEADRKMVDEAGPQEFDVRTVRDRKLREQMEKALEYHQRIEALIQRSEEGVLREHLREATAGVTDWIVNIFNVARRLDAYKSGTMIQRKAQFQDTVDKVEFQLESTLAALGAMYAQLQLVDIRDADSGHAQRLRQDIAEQIASLQIIIEVMGEV